MTTTGGPEHFLADPATDNRPTDGTAVHGHAARLDGDDIVVEPRPPGPGSRRIRLATAGAVAVILLVGGIAVGVANNHHSPNHASKLRPASAQHPPTAHPTPPRAAVKPKIKHAKAVPPNASVTITKTTSGTVAPPASIATRPVETPTTASPPPPVTTPPVEPASVLEWSATPSELSVRAGAQISMTVTVVNPTNGTVTLGTPMSCPPTMRGPRGAVIGDFVCDQMTQVIQPHSKIAQRYTIHATDTGDTTGTVLTPGIYTATVEHLFTIKVIVTNS